MMSRATPSGTPSGYERINLTVEASFSPEGNMVPRRVIYNQVYYPILLVLDRKAAAPEGVRCKDPIEYTTLMIGRIMKKLYYEPSTGIWFSVRGRSHQNEPICAPAGS